MSAIGFSGVHRSGKTTLMHRIAIMLDLVPIEANVGMVFEKMGMKANQSLSIHERMSVQEAVLAHLRDLYRKARAETGGRFTCDRTPIDLIAYTLAEITPTSLGNDKEMAARIERYVASCYATAGEFFSSIVIVQPGIRIVSGGDLKGSLCPAYIEHMNTLMLGATLDGRNTSARMVVPRSMKDLQKRVVYLGSALRDQLESAQERSRGRTLN